MTLLTCPKTHDTRYTAPVVPPAVLAAVCTYAESRSLSPERWFAGSGLDASQLSDPDLRVSYRQASVVLRRALQALQVPEAGLEIGRQETPAFFGVLAFAMMASANLGDALRLAAQYHQVSGSLMDIALDTDSRQQTVIVSATPRFPDPDLLPFLCEELFTSSLTLVQHLLGERFTPLRMEFSYPAPAYAEAYRAAFGCEVRFDCAHNRLIGEQHWLARPLKTHNPFGVRLGEELCRKASRVLPEDDLTHVVGRLLSAQLQAPPGMSEIAGRLNITERTLRRRLAQSGISFRQLLDQVREQRARELLSQPHRQRIIDIAAELGFSDGREFRRAFKRWTGHTPQAMG
ncbi:AraC family transcriptional regulator [Stagnimonas aquatica]|nr:AraC family transcriptional regulator [Stagnimonas aquatica]